MDRTADCPWSKLQVLSCYRYIYSTKIFVSRAFRRVPSGGYDPKNDATRREMWLQRLKGKSRWVYNPATDRDNVPVSPTMYPDYYN